MDQLRVRRLTAILRLAGGLDRSHAQCTPRAAQLLVRAAQNPELDVWGARRRAEMFERVFDLPLTVEWEPPPGTSLAVQST